jgi:hypothetical protein
MPDGTRPWKRLVVQGGFLLMPLLSNACSPVRPPIALDEGMVVVQNQTTREWRNVVVTVNDHFRAGASVLAPGGRLTAPLSQFQTAFGQRFDRGKQRVAKIELTATDGDGKPVSLSWASGRGLDAGSGTRSRKASDPD